MNEQQAVKPFVLLSALDVMNAVPEKRPSVVDDLLLEAGISMIAGKPKSGKSTLVRQLAVAVAHGYTFLGHDTKQGGVLYLSLEGPLGVLGDHFKKLAYTGKRGTIHIVDERMQSRAQGIERLELTLAGLDDCRLVVVDPAVKFLRLSDSNSNDDVSPALERLEMTAKKFGVQILLVFHSKKRVSDDVGDSPLGSTGFRGGTDTNIFLTKEGTQRVLSTEQRWGVALEPTVLTFNEATGEAHLGRSVEDIESTRHESKERRTHDRIKTDLIAAVAEHKAPTRDDLLDAVTGKAATKIEMLAALVSDGLLEKVGTGTKGQPGIYKLRTETVKPLVGVTQ